MTHADKLKGQFSYNKKQVLWLTDMTDEEYSNFQIDTATAWIERYWGDVVDADSITDSSVFWNWWRFAWNEADARMIIETLYAHKPDARHTAYRCMHQYIFNGASADQQYLIADFRNMKEEFLSEIKAQEAKH